MKSHKLYQFLFSVSVLLFLLACTALSSIPPAISTSVPPTETVSATPLPLGEQVTLAAVSEHETSQTPAYEITAHIPTLQGSTDARVVQFNTEMTNLIHGEIDAFKKNVSEIPVDPNFAPSFLDVKYALIFQSDDLFSLKFDFSFYSSGAAHPGHYSITVNYDLAQGRQLVLSDLFLSNANYLERISSYCTADLKRQNPEIDDPFLGGAAPTTENYRNWNIASEGLIITFDEYQVAPYAAGPQAVIVPYTELQTVIDPAGPLAKVIR